MSDKLFITYKLQCPCCSKYVENAFYYKPGKGPSRTIYRGLKPGKKGAERANHEQKRMLFKCEHCFCDFSVKFLVEEAEAGSSSPFETKVVEEGMTKEIEDDDFFYFLDQ